MVDHSGHAILGHFLEVWVCHFQANPLVLELPLPEVDAANLRLQYDDARCCGTPAAESVPEEDWRRLESCFVPGSESNASSWLNVTSAGPSSRASLAAAAASNMCIAGETIAVDVELSNPLQVCGNVVA
jgi:hypothetical protein